MTFQATPNGIEVVLKGNQEGIPVVNVYHVDNGGSVTPTDLATVAGIFKDWWQAEFPTSLHTTFTLDSIAAKDIEVEDGPEHVELLTTGNVGTATGEPMAANAALVIGWRTARTGRSYRGRTYVGGLPNALLVDPHNVAGSTVLGFSNAAAALLEALTLAGKKLCVLSRVLNKVERAVGILTEIISIVVDTKVDSQRRRTAN